MTSPKDIPLVTFRRSPLSAFGRLDTYPFRSALVGAAALWVASKIDQPWAWLLTLVGSVCAVLSQLWHTRDYVTTTHVVRQRGIFGESRQELPLSPDAEVILRESLLRPLDRDLIVRTGSGSVEFLAVRDADATCEQIEALIREMS